MVAIYIAALLFGGVLIAASLLGGAGHGGELHVGDLHGGDASGGDGHGTGYAWLSLFGLRFWSFGAAFFGLTGLVFHRLGGGAWRVTAPVLAAGAGVAAGLGASAVFRALTRDAVGQVRAAGTLVGREGRLLLPVDRVQRGKVRLALPEGGHLDLLAEAGEDEPLAAGAEVMIVEVRGNVAVVVGGPARARQSPPPGEPRGG